MGFSGLMFVRLPDSVRDNCLRGMSLARRAPATVPQAPRAAHEFAELLAEGFPPDTVRARECVDAHMALDRRVVDQGHEDDYGRIVRLLWGGEQGRDFCEQQLAEKPPTPPKPTPHAPGETFHNPSDSGTVLIAADLDDPDSQFHDLCVALNRIDDQTADRLEAAVRLAYLTALRSLTRTSHNAVMATMSKAWREQVGPDMVARREGARALYRRNEAPYVAAQLIEPVVMAELTIDQESAIVGALEDLALTADEILARGQNETVRVLAEELDTTEAEIRAQLQELMDQQRDSSTGLLLAGLTAFTLSRADRSDGQVTEALEAAVIPAQLISSTLAVAGGAQRADFAAARTIDGAFELVTGGISEAGTVSTGWLNATFERVLGVPLRTTYEWFYGSPADREQPRVDHQRQDGLRWTTTDERQAGLEQTDALVEGDIGPDVYPGSLPGCKCKARTVKLGILTSVQ